MSQSHSQHGREPVDTAQAPTVLALETSTDACSVALSARGLLFADHRIAPREHNRLILPMVDALLRSARVERRELDAVALGRGPGSFTGVRIAAGIAQGIALGLRIPVVPVSSLAALACAAGAAYPNVSCVLATIRSRTDEIYVGGYRIDGDRCEAIVPESVWTASRRDVPVGIDSTWAVVGDGVAHFAGSLAELGCSFDASLRPTASGVLRLAMRAVANGEGVEPAEALPVYLQGTRQWRKLAD